MPDLDCSEIQFAFTFFAKFNEYFKYRFSDIIAPSTILEGKDSYTYNGVDLVLDSFFIQFKMSKLLNRSDALEFVTHKNPTLPYFRFKIKNLPAATSSGIGQLDYLIQHSKDPNKTVLYVCPSFDNKIFSGASNKKNFWYKNFYTSPAKKIDDFCAFVDVKSIPVSAVTSDDTHVMCFKHGSSDGYFCSQPEIVKKRRLGNIFRNYNEQIISKDDSIKSLDTIVGELEDELKKMEISYDDNKYANKLHFVQRELLETMNVFWIPIIISKAKYRERRADYLIID